MDLCNKTFIDLFAGIGGFHQALSAFGAKCVFASEIDKYASDTYLDNYGIAPVGDITAIHESTIPKHDAGFVRQAFSIAGKLTMCVARCFLILCVLSITITQA